MEKELKKYEDLFNESFPTFNFISKSENEIIEIINECIKKKKDVYELGYIESDDIDVYY